MTLTIGLIGCGRWGTIHHATLMSLKQEGYLDRLIVCDIDATARDAVEADAEGVKGEGEEQKGQLRRRVAQPEVAAEEQEAVEKGRRELLGEEG